MVRSNFYFFVKLYSRLNNINININSKKAISPVVATALLLVVAVVAVVGFQGWLGSFSSNLFTKIETQTNDGILDGTLAIDTLIGSTLYVKNGIVDNLSINNLKIGGVLCNITGQENLSLGINEINVTSCLSNLTTNTPNIVLITDTKILDKQVFVENLPPAAITYASCTLDSLTVPHANSGIFYNSSLGQTCYSQARTCTDGTLNGSSTYNKSTCIVTELLCLTDLDGDGFINSTCAIYPMTNTTFSGNLDTNDNNNTIHPDMSCIFDGDKNSTSCLNNFVVDGCGSGTVQDISTNLCWQRNLSTAGTKTWANAITYCDGLSLGAQTDWRLPTHEELISITDLSRYNPAIVGGNNNKFQNVQNNLYWTYSTYGPFSTNAWLVYFDGGYDDNGVKTGTYYVVCVR